MAWHDGDPDALRRLFKLSLLSGLFLSAPLLVGTLWYAWSSYAAIARYQRATDPKGSVDRELFQIALHDELVRDLRALSTPERPLVDRLPTYELSLSRADVDTLTAQLGTGGGPAGAPKTYVDGLLKAGGEVHEVEVRYRGEQAWHAQGAQKSMKIRVKRGDLVDGVRVFNLLNDPTPFGLEDQIILDLARESGLLTPDYRAVRVRLNNHDLGVYRLESQPDESLLRSARRIPGNMYSGDAEKLKGDQRLGPLFTSTIGWTKNADRNEEHATDVSELMRFIAAVRDDTHQAFAEYARQSLDLDRYARFDALDVVFGGNEHDFLSNHRFYADPYRGKLEPVAWSFRGFSREESFNGVDNPILIRLKNTPGYLARRDRAVYAFLTGKASVPAIHARAEQGVLGLAEELAADPYWDAYKLLPRASKLHRNLTRPMSLERWILATEYEIDGYGQRSRYLLDVLEEPDVTVTSGAAKNGARVDVTVREHAAYAVEEIRATAACGGSYRAYADADLDAQRAASDPLLASAPYGQSAPLSRYAELTARNRLVPRADADAKRGWVKAETAPTTYTYFVEGDACAPTKIVLVLRSLVTGASVRVEVVPGAAAAEGPSPSPSPEARVAITAVPQLIAGELAPHPWSYPQPEPPRTITLGPGRVELAETRTFGEHETVEIAAGTTLALGPGASLVFHGPVFARGTPERPIEVKRLEPAQPFGGLALQGQATAGSKLVELRVDGGSRPRDTAVEYTAVFSAHDTHDVTLESWVITGTRDDEDVIHAYEVKNLVLHEIELEKAPIDGIDLEFVTADLRGVRILGAGDDGLDLMGSTLRLQDSLIAGCANNGISAGEETEVTATSVVVSGAKTGVLAKNASTVRLVRSLVHHTKLALRARRKETRYGGPSRVGISDTFVAAAETVQDSDKGSAIDVDRLRVDLPGTGELPHLLEQVMRSKTWADAEAELDALRDRSGGAP